MSYMLTHLKSGWQLDQLILAEEDRVVVVRFGHDWDETGMEMDETLYAITDKIKNFGVIYLVCCLLLASESLHLHLHIQYSIHSCKCSFAFSPSHLLVAVGGYLQGARFQQDVRALRPLHSHVFLPQQAHDDRSRHGKQQ